MVQESVLSQYFAGHFSGEAATHRIARFSGRSAVLRLVAGGGHAALPDGRKTAHSGAFNCGF
jgi:hypothetical protein